METNSPISRCLMLCAAAFILILMQPQVASATLHEQTPDDTPRERSPDKEGGDERGRYPQLTAAQRGDGCDIFMPPGVQRATFEGTLWQERLVNFGPLVLGVVPYEFNTDPISPGFVSDTRRLRALASMNEIEAWSNVQFVPRQGFHTNWIRIEHGPGNGSFIGMITNPPGAQLLTVNTWNSNPGGVNFVIVHELLHALGFWHEHQRHDRNTFVRINDGTGGTTNCIQQGAEHNFTIRPTAQTLTPYDYQSVMHYGQFHFSNGCPTIEVLPVWACAPGTGFPGTLCLITRIPWQPAIGQRVMLSAGDIDGLCAKYGCDPVNDTCAGAITVTDGITITDNRWATTQPIGGCASIRDVWYVYDASCTGEVTVTLTNISAGYTAIMGIYRNQCGANPADLVVCDSSPPIHAQFIVSQGERYYIRIGGTFAGGGTARLNITCAPVNCTAGLQWAQVATGDPGSRYDHDMVYDSHPSRQQIILFGGLTSAPGPSGDTWAWSSASQMWTLRSTVGPQPRFNHAMAYDSSRQRVVLFGGHDGSSLLSDTWEYNPATNTWAQIFPANAPSARVWHRMVYDSARQRVVLFGGLNGSPLQDTWEWNGTNWTLMATGPMTPRYLTGMAYDRVRQVTVMWSGSNLSGVIADTSVWEWNGTTWTQKIVASPTGRASHRMAFDSVHNLVLLFGGFEDGAPPPPPNNVWSWNGSIWNNHGNATAPPGGRTRHPMVFDDSAGALVVQGGLMSGTLQSDTWRALLVGMANDDPASAIPIGNGTYSFDNRCALSSSGSCATGRDIWYRYTATTTGSLTASITGAAGTNFTPQVAIYPASNPFGPHLACATANPPTAPTPVAKAIITAPGDYLIRVGGTGQFGGVGNLVVSGQPQPCPPPIVIPGSYYQRVYEITGTSTGQPWAWKIQRGTDVLFELNAPGVPAGSNAVALTAAFVASINAHQCDTSRLAAFQLPFPNANKFRVVLGGSNIFFLCVGAAGQLPGSCCPASYLSCPFNADIREIALSGLDCNGNGVDDTIDLLMGTSLDVNETGVPDECELACTGDLNGDSTVDVLDLLILLGNWGPCNPDETCPADLNSDGTTDVLDLLILLGNWGACQGLPLFDSCAGYCGGVTPSGCWCDPLCFAFSDCCDDLCLACADLFPDGACPPAPIGACCLGLKECIEQLHVTDCDAIGGTFMGPLTTCKTPGCSEGPLPHSCAGNCGGQAPGGCWCDIPACCDFGDCCPDYAQHCGNCDGSD